MKEQKNIKLTLSKICELNKQNKLIPCENVPGVACDYDDGWEDEEGYSAVEDLLDLILYFSGKKNLCEGADTMLGLKKKDYKKYLQNLMQIFDNDITIISEGENFLLYGKINEWTAIKICCMKQELIKQDKIWIENQKAL